uniref:Phospholipase-like, aminotransferase-like mobile domain protein n=1 Tax=Tanacetum cinerariifolium TaxID=118510 RepID=A0A6L2NL29_TANCI|nr:phospholipase-like, aminotransferase-like mobile domain protein [Tanacetum cinerariifolium]
MTAFKFGLLSFCEYRNGDILFRNRLFPKKIRYDVKIIDVLALLDDEEKFSKVRDKDAIRVCLLLSLEGENIWRQLYDSIKNVSSKHKHEHLDVLGKNPNHVLSYSLTGFLYAFKSVLVYRIVGGPKFQKSSRELCHGGEKHNLTSLSILAIFFIRRDVWSISKRSSARMRKKKSSEEFHTGVCGREKGREAALIDRVRDLEGIWETLLTLPKEFKSLRGRIFKLKSIIQASLYPTRGFGKEETLIKLAYKLKIFYRPHQRISQTSKMTHLP